jgi:hypothetical protein
MRFSFCALTAGAPRVRRMAWVGASNSLLLQGGPIERRALQLFARA